MGDSKKDDESGKSEPEGSRWWLREYSTEDLIEQLQEVAEDLGETPTCHQMIEYPDTPNPATYKSRFGSWNEAVRECGLEPNKPGISVDEQREEQLLAKIQELSEKIDRDGSPTAREMDRWSQKDEGFPCQSTIRNVFGSWKKGVEKAGLSPYTRSRRPKETIREEGVDYFPIGSGWHKQREKVIERDGGACVDCGRSREKHREMYHGIDLHVHHLVPREWFYNDDRVTIDEHGNQLANLVTICCEHHKRWGQRRVDPRKIGIELPVGF